jgi:hypothetical protein
MQHVHSSDPPLAQAGQAAFAAIQEVVARLDADPSTDWSKVNIDRLRNHLLDMDEVMMRARSEVTPIDGGVRISVTGEGATLDAIKRMIPAHAAMMNGYHEWRGQTETRVDSVVWTILTPSESERTRIRALGLFGLLTLGSHHGPHHLAMAKGQLTH